MPPIKSLHKWDVSYKEAIATQNRLRAKVSFSALKRKVRTVAGADVAYHKPTQSIYAAIAVLSFPSLDTLEQTVVEGKSAFPYIPGLLSFREAPIVSKAYKNLSTKPDFLICDGQGVAHPRGFGLASHLGLLFDIPSAGCAKSRLCGEHREVGPEVGNRAPLKMDGKTIGAVVRTRKGVKPVYVSVGHMIGLRGAVRLVLRCCAGYRIPEPTRRAHLLVTAAKKGASGAHTHRPGKKR